MSTITERRAALRAEARKRAKDTLPKLRAKVKAAKLRKTERLKRCRTDCALRRKKVREQGLEARRKLRERLAAAKDKAREFCSVCRVSAAGAELDRIDTALAALEQERAHIRALRSKASGLVDPRGQAAGRRSAELRAELEDEVTRNVSDDRELAELWANQRDRYRRFAPTQRTSMTERFLEWVEAHPEALDELRARQEVAWEREASELLKQWPRSVAIGDMSDQDLARLARDHDRAEALTEREPGADTLHFAELVHEAGRDPSTVRVGNRAYLRSVYNTLRRRNYPTSWPQFQAALREAHAEHALRLERAELIPATQRKIAKDSTVMHGGRSYQLVEIPAQIPF